MRKITVLLSTLLLVMGVTSCSKEKSVDQNPFFTEWDTPFGVPPFDKIKAEHYEPAFERAFSRHAAEIEAIVENNDDPTFENVILAYDNSGKELTQTSLVFGMVSAAEATPELLKLQEVIMPQMSSHYDAIRLNDGLFDKVKQIFDKRNSLGLDAEQMRLLEHTYNGFVRSGALLTAEQKERLKQINGELSLASVKFGQNLLAENNDFVMKLGRNQLTGLPSSVRDAAMEKSKSLDLGTDTWAFTLHKPSLLPFLTYSSERALREELYKGYLQRGNNDNELDNKGLINDMVRLRVEKAQMLGFNTFAEYVTADQMAKTPEAVLSLLEEIWTPALERSKAEVEEMDKLLQKDHPGATFESWDWWYYAEKLRKQNYNLDEEMLRPYFELEKVQDGAFFLANRLFGITFRPVAVPVYHEEVWAFEVLDADGSHLGILFMDYFPREGKSQGAWCGSYTEQLYDGDERIAPIVSIVCNFTRPTATTPALLSSDEVETLFHEFGHGLHNLFAKVKYRGLADVEGDFVELPSQIMENWAFQPELLKFYATHYRTNEQMPKELVDKLRRSSLFNQGFVTTELAAAALSDIYIHSIDKYETLDVNKFEKDLLNGKLGLISQIEPRYRYPYFAHIFDGGYASGYYFYLWAEVLDKDAYEAFVETGDLFDKATAKKFREEILQRGGSADGMTMYRAFRGQEPNKDAMLKGRGLLNE